MNALSDGGRLKVFVSYSRSDCSAFAQDLLIGLELAGFAPFLDRHDIAAGEDWEERLAGLILAADTIVFVVSPGAVKSERCAWEVAKALELGKRLVPVVAIRVPDDDVPAELRRINYIYFDQSYFRPLRELTDALRMDLTWIREHTRVAELAARWQGRDQPEVLLLRGTELAAAEEWLAGWKSGAPEPTDLHRVFIAASSEAEAIRTNLERKRLEEIALAQKAHADALAQQEQTIRKLRQRTIAGVALATLLTAAGGSFAVWAVRAERDLATARQEVKDVRTRLSEELTKLRQQEPPPPHTAEHDR